jgi:hypothetical protein
MRTREEPASRFRSGEGTAAGLVDGSGEWTEISTVDGSGVDGSGGVRMMHEGGGVGGPNSSNETWASEAAEGGEEKLLAQKGGGGGKITRFGVCTFCPLGGVGLR